MKSYEIHCLESIPRNLHLVSHRFAEVLDEIQNVKCPECYLDSGIYMIPCYPLSTPDEIPISFRHFGGHMMFKKRRATDTSGRCDFSMFTLVVLFAPNVHTGGPFRHYPRQDLSFA